VRNWKLVGGMDKPTDHPVQTFERPAEMQSPASVKDCASKLETLGRIEVNPYAEASNQPYGSGEKGSCY